MDTLKLRGLSLVFSSSRASYEISLLIAKHGKNHTIGEQLTKPAISIFLKTVLQKDDGDIRTMPLSNNTVSNRIDEMGQDVESQLIEKLKLRKFSLQMDESTIRDSEALLLTYVRYIDHEEFQEEMLFCESFETTTTANDICIKIKHYLDANKIPKENLLACAADGAPAMMGKNTGCLKMMKDENPNMLTVHCVIHRENLVAKKLSPVLNKILQSVIKCVNSIKRNSKSERLFKQFCINQSAEHVRLLLDTEVRWLSSGNCLKRFMELFDQINDFLSDKCEMKLLSTTDGKAFVSYLTDIFEKLGNLNKQLQGANMTLIDAKAKIFGFITALELWKKKFSKRNFSELYWLSKCEITNDAGIVIIDHLNILIKDFNDRFCDLKAMNFPSWLTQPLLINVSDATIQYQEELSELQHDESVKTLFKLKGTKMWLYDEVERKYPKISTSARELLIPFPSSYLVECGFSAVDNLLEAKRNRLEITKRGDLRLKLTKLSPQIKNLCYFFSILQRGKRPRHEAKKGFRDAVKSNFKAVIVDVEDWVQLTRDQSVWKDVIYDGCKPFETRRIEQSILKRALRKQNLTSIPDTLIPGNDCNISLSKAGIALHMRFHDGIY
ncbi:SCAN domain-containing protein 3-like [Octopus sinensis]|uniref:SCAN domain-containing protein 3-like n=1 Tax=Octopus sinensis TaxID=2607531 RepID=A0A6P7S658_9MOLL|nr:SCAN domain-containing protein 3-like [Octopus sinensis]